MWIIKKIGEFIKSQNKKQITEEDIIEYINRKEKSEEKKFKTKYEITEESIIEYIQSQILGKTYAISDIHGMYGSYMEAINNLKENDTLYVIGDVIDRGKNGIKILQDMMRRKNVKFILGNHEWQMMQVLDLIRKYNLSENDIVNYIKAGEQIYSERDWRKDGDEEQAEKCRKNKEEYLKEISNIQLDDYDMRLMYIWTLANKGVYTLDEFLSLTKEQQDKIYNYVKEAAVMAKKQVNNKNIIMVHAAPLELEYLVDSASKKSEGAIKYSTIVGMDDKKMSQSVLSICTETRNDTSGFAFWKKYGYKTIYGHTPQYGEILVDNVNDAVCIDTGCSRWKGKLALYCLDDESVKYIDRKEDYIKEEKGYGED